MSVKIELNHRGIDELLKSAEIAAVVEAEADKIARRAGAGHVVKRGVGRTRARATVVTDTPDAMVAEAAHRNLTRSVQ